MNRLTASALVLLLWALIYLPGLGSTELKGEEGRRILPAITMLDSGHWLVPYVGGKPFLRKPPLVNWAIAGMFRLTGVRNAWTARLPAAFCVLALGLTIVGTSGRGWISPETALVAAVLAMTQFGLLAKARFAGAEIEGIYAPLSGMAVVCWLAAWAQGRSPWRIWLLPGALLGLASLAKGPSLHLLFFYVIVCAVLARARQWRALVQPAHFAALVLAAAIFAAWAVPYFRLPETKDAAAVWKRQGIDRFTESDFNPGNYFTNLPRGLGDQLPWVLFAPVLVGALRRRSGANSGPVACGEGGDATQCIFQAASGAVLACFVGVLLIPGTLPRYVLPLGAPFALVLALALCTVPHPEPALRRWQVANVGLAGIIGLLAIIGPGAAAAPMGASAGWDLGSLWRIGLLSLGMLAIGCAVIGRRKERPIPERLVITTGLLLGMAAIFYAAGAVRWINRADDVRPFAAAIDAAIPPGKPLIIYDPGYLAAIFYLRTPYRYALESADVPADAEWLLVRARQWKKMAPRFPHWNEARNLEIKSAGQFLLLQRSTELQKLSIP